MSVPFFSSQLAEVFKPFYRVASFFGLSTRWNMFSPDPSRNDNRIWARLELNTGKVFMIPAFATVSIDEFNGGPSGKTELVFDPYLWKWSLDFQLVDAGKILKKAALEHYKMQISQRKNHDETAF